MRSHRGPALALPLFLGLALTARADDLDRQLKTEAPKLLKRLQDRGCKNVGVLKFRVVKGKDAARHTVGTLNLDLADRLEKALVMASDPEKPAIGIIGNASATAAKTSGANHLTKEGRLKLFEASYPLAWGDKTVKPDFLITGVAIISPDLRKLTVGLVLLDRTKDGMEKGPEFHADMTSALLAAAGESFRTRGIHDAGNEVIGEDKAVEMAGRVKDRSNQPHPLEDKESPVLLEIFYDDKPAEVKVEGGKARVAEPREGQKVHFVLKLRPDAKQRYAVVLKVNGESTIGKQRLRDADCRKWVLEPGKPMPLRGFQMDDKSIKVFRVLSDAESQKRQMDYGADVGTISLGVFAEKKDKVPAAADEKDLDVLVVTRGVYPEEPAQNLNALQEQLRQSAKKQATRGMMVDGDTRRSSTRTVPFEADPTPVQAAVITYYKP